MVHPKNNSRRRLALLLASSWCASAALVAQEAPVAPAATSTAATPAPAPETQGTQGTEETKGTSAAEQVAPPAPAPAPAPAAPAAVAPIPRTQSVVINLINRLVKKGHLDADEAAELIKDAEDEAKAVREETMATQAAFAQLASGQVAPGVFPDDPLPSPAQRAAAEEDNSMVRITYIPEYVKAQIRDEIRQSVMAEARQEKWTGTVPYIFPEWTTRMKVFADFRMRYQGDFFDEGNDNTGAFPNFNAINTGAPFDVSGTQFSPQNNVDQDRNRVRLRLRLGLEADLGDGFTAGVRVASGESNSPTSPNQTLGSSGGNFSKYAIWLDRAFVKYEVGDADHKLTMSIGRFDNPFFSTDIVWDEDLGFDGAALQAKYKINKVFTPFLTAGAFPVYNTDFSFASNQPAKFSSYDKWVYGGQLGTNLKLSKNLTAKVAGAYYYFQNIEGQLSEPYTPLNANDAGNTDTSRPSFAQKGNTYMALRNIVPNASNNFGTTNQFQYFGLATPFQNLVFTGRLDYNGFEPVQISLVGEYVKNLAFDQNEINAKAVNNRGPNSPLGAVGTYEGGDTAWMIALKAGHPALEKRWDWNAAVGYRYVESDAVVDGFTDSDFGGGGTNVQGYYISANLALSPRVWIGMRWMSADQIAGPPLKTDTLQFEFNSKF